MAENKDVPRETSRPLIERLAAVFRGRQHVPAPDIKSTPGGELQMPLVIRAGSEIPPPAPPTKVSNKQITLPSYLTTAKPPKESPLLRADRLLANRDITSYRTSQDSRQTIRDFTRASPDLSAAVTSYIRTGITAGYTAIAKNRDGTVNPEGTAALQQVITRMNVLNDYTIGYDSSPSLRSLSEAWARDLVTQGACAGELVLDKGRLPDFIHPISSTQIRLFPSSDAKRLIPKQFLAGEYYNLDVPTFFMVTLDADLLEPYPISPIEPAIQAVIFSAEFMNDIRRVVRKAIHPRWVFTINEEKFRKAVPPDIVADAKKLEAYMAQVVGDLESKVNGLEPEDVIVTFDTIGIDIKDHGNTGLNEEYKVIEGMANSKVATGAKVLPTVLGHSDGTSNTASAEVLMFMKYVEGTVWAKLNEMLSKVFTLAVRLMGYDVYVEFSYNAIDLRPENELEAFKAMKQSRVLELLSLGLMDDAEACVALTGHLPPAGATPLMGTRFHGKSAQPAGDGYNGASNDGSTMNQNLKSDAPKAPKGKQSAEIVHLQSDRTVN